MAGDEFSDLNATLQNGQIVSGLLITGRDEEGMDNNGC